MSIIELVRMAASLRSECGDNPEYDKALVDIVTAALGGTSDDGDAVARLLGIGERAE